MSTADRRRGHRIAELCSRTSASMASLVAVKCGLQQSAVNCGSVEFVVASYRILQPPVSLTTTVELRQQRPWQVSTNLCLSKCSCATISLLLHARISGDSVKVA